MNVEEKVWRHQIYNRLLSRACGNLAWCNAVRARKSLITEVCNDIDLHIMDE